MTTPLLTTKVQIPLPRANLVPRSRLIERLDELVHPGRRLALVSAPAGFGKTTLLSEWAAGPERPVAWLSLDQADNDPARFLAYLVAALQTIEPDLGVRTTGALQSPQPPIEAVLTALINEIAAVPHTLVLVLDDYHVIEEQVIHEALAFLLDHGPPQLRLAILTRADPPLPLPRLRASGEMSEIRADDLRFVVEESAVFLNEVMDLDLEPQQVAALGARTEGWVAGLQLAAVSLRGLERETDVDSFIKAFTGSNRYVMDYLMEEVINRQPPDVHQFLLQTSILDRLCGPLCDAVVRQDVRESQSNDGILPYDGWEMLERLEQTNLFTVPVDHQRRWYRYHHLFADLLRDRLRQAQPERVPELHRRAAKWYESNGLMEDAVHHALQAEDFGLATRLIEQVAFSLWRLSNQRMLLSWMRALPPELVHSHPALDLHYAAALIVTGRLDDAEPWLQSAEAQLREMEGSSATQVSRAIVHRLRAYVARFSGTVPEAITCSHQALERTPADRPDLRGVALLHVGHAHFLNGEADLAAQALIEASETCRATGHLAAYLSSVHYLAQLRVLQGRLRKASAIYQQAIQFVADQDEPVFAGVERIGIGDLLREQNDLEVAARHLQEGVRLAELGGDFVFLRDGYVAGARLEQALGNPAGALDFMQKAEQVVRQHRSSWETALVEAWRARLWLAQGDLAAAGHWAAVSGLSVDDDLDFLREFGHLTLARVLLAQGRPAEAGRLLERLLRSARSAGRMGRVIDILVVQALAREARGNAAGALEALGRALELAEPEGYVRTLVDEGPAMAALLRRALSRGVAPTYVGWLLAAFEEPPADPGLVEPLTPRELEVLRLIAVGMKNQEIADQLVISVHTVKRHISNLYGKLAVSHRTQAVARARDVGLL